MTVNGVMTEYFSFIADLDDTAEPDQHLAKAYGP